MKPVLFYLILFFWCISCHNVKTTAPPKPLTGNIQTDLKILLPDGTVKAEIMDSVKVNARQNCNLPLFRTGCKYTNLKIFLLCHLETESIN